MFLGGRNICLIKKVDFMSLSDKAADNLPGAFLFWNKPSAAGTGLRRFVGADTKFCAYLLGELAAFSLLFDRGYRLADYA